uniref:Uncharacterized protein n=1 Tax=Kalanchoe fedtschenkoi TaxID=63787 RepID=A0A7N0R914_KALFE
MMISSGTPQCFMICLKNIFAATSAEHTAGAGMKVPYFVNLSTTTIIERKPSTFGNPPIKSIETLCHGFFGIGSGCNSPASLRF